MRGAIILAATIRSVKSFTRATTVRSTSLSVARGGSRMPNGVKKENLPTKVCVTCQRPFTWRKKWERCWDEVQCCSKKCNGERKRGGAPAPLDDDDEAPALSTRKAAKKATKALRRAKRAGVADESNGQKTCDLCDARVNLLVRCQTDTTKQWYMACGRCWKDVSGGVPDGDAAHPHYRYGGLWKNRNVQSGEGIPELEAQGVVLENIYCITTTLVLRRAGSLKNQLA